MYALYASLENCSDCVKLSRRLRELAVEIGPNHPQYNVLRGVFNTTHIKFNRMRLIESTSSASVHENNIGAKNAIGDSNDALTDSGTETDGEGQDSPVGNVSEKRTRRRRIVVRNRENLSERNVSDIMAVTLEWKREAKNKKKEAAVSSRKRVRSIALGNNSDDDDDDDNTKKKKKNKKSEEGVQTINLKNIAPDVLVNIIGFIPSKKYFVYCVQMCTLFSSNADLRRAMRDAITAVDSSENLIQRRISHEEAFFFNDQDGVKYEAKKILPPIKQLRESKTPFFDYMKNCLQRLATPKGNWRSEPASICDYCLGTTRSSGSIPKEWAQRADGEITCCTCYLRKNRDKLLTLHDAKVLFGFCKINHAVQLGRSSKFHFTAEASCHLPHNRIIFSNVSYYLREEVEESYALVFGGGAEFESQFDPDDP